MPTYIEKLLKSNT